MMYDETEVQEIRSKINAPLDKDQIASIKKLFPEGVQRHLLSFVSLAITNPDLYAKLQNDKEVERFSLFAFFPEMYDLVYGSEESPTIKATQGNRGLVLLVSHARTKRVIKPFQSSREGDIANIAAELEVGPRQYESIDGFLTEEHVEGNSFLNLSEEQLTDDNLYQTGRRVGEILRKLHARDICYNDTTIADDMGKSHLIVPVNRPTKLIDFGAAILLDKHPDLTEGDIFNYLRTLPGLNMILNGNPLFGMPGPSEEKIRTVIQEYGHIPRSLSKEEIMTRDADFISEGTYCASTRLGKNLNETFSKGFEETYFK